MDNPDPDLGPVMQARGDMPAERHCLRCKAAFWSEGFGERICKRCKAQASWKSAPAASGGGGGRRSAR